MTLTTGAGWDTLAEAQFGSSPVWRVQIGTTRVATEYQDVGAGIIFYPYLVNIGELRYAFDGDGAFASIASCTIRLRRSTAFDTTFAADPSHGDTVTIWLNFVGTSIAVQVGLLTVRGSTIMGAGEIEVYAEADETAFIPIPSLLMSDIAAAVYADHNIAQSPELKPEDTQPLVIGFVGIADHDPDLPFGLLRKDVCKEPCVVGVRNLGMYHAGDAATEGGIAFLVNSANGQTATLTNDDYLLEYIPEWERYAYVRFDVDAETAQGFDVFKHSTTGPIYAAHFAPHLTLATVPKARATEFRIMAVEFDGSYQDPGSSNNNQVDDWQAVNDGTGITLDVAGGITRLALIVSHSGGVPSNFKEWDTVGSPGNTEVRYTIASLAGTGTPSVKVYDNGVISTDSRGTIGSTHTTNDFFSQLSFQGDFENQKNWFILWELQNVTGDESCIIKDVYWQTIWRSNVDVTTRLKAWETAREEEYTPPGRHGAKRRRGSRTVYDYRTRRTNAPSFPNIMYIAHAGPNATIQPVSTSYTYDSPMYAIYYMLETVFGIAAAKIDAAACDVAYAWLTTDAGGNFNSWHVGRQFIDQVDGLDALGSLLKPCGLIMYRSAEDKWKLAIDNHAGTVIETFSDTSTDFPAWDFSWRWGTEYWNDFVFKYRWNPGKGDFSKEIVVNKDATVSTFLADAKTQCGDAYTNYGSVRKHDPIELYWVWDELTAENVAKIAVNKLAVLRRMVSFKSKLAASKIEIGDTIRTDHQVQTWATGAVSFMVSSISIAPADGTVAIEAVEINEFP